MGLYLVCGMNMSQGVGSYSFVHIHRYILMKCAYYYILYMIEQNEENTEDLEILKQHIYKVIENNTDIDYTYLDDTYYTIFIMMKKYGIEGVLYWVFHSDWDGELKHNQSKKILDFVSKTMPRVIHYFIENNDTPTIFNILHVDESNYKDYDINKIYKKYYLYDIFKYSVKKRKTIEFC